MTPLNDESGEKKIGTSTTGEKSNAISEKQKVRDKHELCFTQWLFKQHFQTSQYWQMLIYWILNSANFLDYIVCTTDYLVSKLVD